MNLEFLKQIKSKTMVTMMVSACLLLIVGLTSIILFAVAGVSKGIIIGTTLGVLIASLVILILSFRNVLNSVLKITDCLQEEAENLFEKGMIKESALQDNEPKTFAVMNSIINEMLKDTQKLLEEHKKNNRSFMIETGKYKGVFALLCKTMNDLVMTYSDAFVAAEEAVIRLRNGDWNKEIATNTQNKMMLSLEDLRTELLQVCKNVSGLEGSVATGTLDASVCHAQFKGGLAPIGESLLSISKMVCKKYFWYDSILDAIPFPMSVTDMNMNWTFINKPVENLLKVKRKDLLGKHCSNWGACICKTKDCGIDSLRKGKEITYFQQFGADFQVNLSYLYDADKNQIGHVEVVQDISRLRAFESKHAFAKKIKEASDAFLAVSNKMAESSQQTAANAFTQSEFMQKLSSAFESLLNKAKSMSEIAKQTSTSTAEIKSQAQLGHTQMKDMLKSVSDMTDANHSIFKIIKNIEDIAFQTNILALNASVEAARAGQAGKGFAVVAEEVRNLATKSGEAAKDSDALIHNSLEKADKSEKIVHETSDSFNTIVLGINNCDERTHSIAQSSDEQISLLDELDHEIAKMSHSVTENSQTAEQNAASSQELSSQALALEELVNDFIKESEKI